MTPIRVGPDAIFHRFHSPDWAHLPTSGAGAAANGGRFNRPGVEALYLSVEPETALAEYRQGATIAPPATLVAYRVDVDGIVDFSGGYDPATWPDDWVDAGCDWKYIARIERRDPPTWRIGDALIRDGVKGLLFPSYRHPGGTNLVLFSANLGPDDRVAPHDPAGRLPRDRRSWT
ncbi:MAG: RES family NAD+ phosphorylase [Rhodospirillales bacterium]|nr:RES family NAD+ phosphorylase [Rhodospirillales bacterium]